MGFLLSTIVGSISDANRLAKQSKAQKDNKTKNVVVQGKYSIDVPSFLSPMKNLSDDASLQYGSRTLDISFIVIDEPKSEFIQSFNDLQAEFPPVFGSNNSILDRMATIVLSNMFDVEKVELGGRQKTMINGLNALIVNVFLRRSFLKDSLYGSFAFIEGKDTLYQINILSGGTSITKLADKIEKSIYSFREL